MTKRKHRLYLDITFNVKLSKREAAKAAQMVIDRASFGTERVYTAEPALYVDKLSVIEPKVLP